MNRRFARPQLLVAAILLTLGGSSMALDTHFGGFGTASLSCFSNDSADYVINTQPEGTGRTRNCDGGLDSLLGVQLDLGLSDSVEFGLQLIADRNADRDYNPEVSVAQLRWRPSDTTTIRVGRMPTASLLHSEDRQVRYAMPWVRPPVEVYGLMPAFSHDGLDIIHQGRLGDWHTEWHGGITTSEFDFPISNSDDTYTVKADVLFLHLSLRQSNTLFKLGYAYGRITVLLTDMETLLGLLPSALADELAIDDSTSNLFVVGAKHEQSDWLVMSEFGYRSLEGAFRDQYGAYVTLGRRFGPWMPYTTLAKRWTSGPDSDSRAGFLQPQVEALLATTRYDTTSLALGLSREITEQATLKFQADWIRPDDDSWGLYTNHGPDYDYANLDSDWLLTLSLDFVF